MCMIHSLDIVWQDKAHLEAIITAFRRIAGHSDPTAHEYADQSHISKIVYALRRGTPRRGGIPLVVKVHQDKQNRPTVSIPDEADESNSVVVRVAYINNNHYVVIVPQDRALVCFFAPLFLSSP